MNKLCECGCGKEVSNPKNRFIFNHHGKGKPRSLSAKLKTEKTNMKKFGVIHPMKSQIIRDKTEATCVRRYGAKTNLLNKDQIEKIKQTNLKNHGVDNPFKSEEVKDKIKKTNFKKYGVENPGKSTFIKDKIKNTCLKKYGYDNFSKTIEGRRNSRLTAVKCIENQLENNEPVMPRVGLKERSFLNELQKHTHYNIIRQDSFFKYKIARFPDGHIPELKLVILFDERIHFINKECTIYNNETILETDDYKGIEGYTLFRVSETSWLKDQNKEIQKFQLLLSKLM